MQRYAHPRSPYYWASWVTWQRKVVPWTVQLAAVGHAEGLWRRRQELVVRASQITCPSSVSWEQVSMEQRWLKVLAVV